MEKLHFLRYKADSLSHQNNLFCFGASVLKSVMRLSLLLVLMLLTAGANKAWGQTDYSGTYYIASDGNAATVNNKNTTEDYTYSSSTPETNYYIVPASNPQQSNKNDAYFDGALEQKPFLTTYKTNKSSESLWNLTQVTDNGVIYYYIKHVQTGKYVVYDPFWPNNDNLWRRKCMHLDGTSVPEGDAGKFIVGERDGAYYIQPKSPKNNTFIYWNIADKNRNARYGLDGSYYYGGLIGLYQLEKSKLDTNSRFMLEDYITRPSIAYNASGLVEITAAQTSGTITIKYTTDGTTPSSSHGETYNAPFDLADDQTTVKAIVIVDGETSNVAEFTPIIHVGSSRVRLIQSQNNAWNGTDFHFYMVPGDEDANSILKVNTTSLFRPTMEWYFLGAGVEGGVQYYYIVNKANGKYLCYDATYEVYMDDFGSGGNKFKFIIEESPTAGTFNIRPYGLTSGNRFVNKANNNDNAGFINLGGTASHANIRWAFVMPADLDKTAPFTASVPASGSYTYYKIASVGSSGFYIVPGTTNVTTSNTDSNNMNWYFEEAQAANASDWLTYYHIRNAVTGDYLYFTKDANNAGACLETRSTIEAGNEDRYMFTWAKTAATTENYYIIPKKLKDISQNQFSSLQRDNSTLKTDLNRGAGNFAWTFVSSSYTCATPTITWSAEDNGYVITSTEKDAKIYYTMGETPSDPNTSSTPYTTALPVATLDVASVTIKAIATRNTADVSAIASLTVNRIATPTFTLTADGKVELTSATEGVDIYYEMGASPSDPTTSSTHYTGPIENAEGKVIKAIAVKGGMINSTIATSNAVSFPCARPVIRKTSSTTFTIECSYPASGVTIYYEMGENPSDPTLSSQHITSGQEITATFPITVKAMAVAAGYSNSEIATTTLSANPDYSGYYYLQSQGNKAYYMSPSGTNHPSHEGCPLVQTKQNQELESVWQIQLKENTDYYRIIHYSDRKYLVADRTAAEQSVWLQGTNPNDGTELFEITLVSDGIYNIKPIEAANSEDKNYLNVTGGNSSNHTIGLLTAGDNNSKWALTKVPATPTFTVNDIKVTINNLFKSDSKIYYTTDGTDPTSASTNGTSVTLEYGPKITVKAICIYDTPNPDWISDVATRTVQVAVMDPVLSKVGNTVTISNTQKVSNPDKVAFWYTIGTTTPDDPVPNGTGELYSGAITLTDNSTNIIKAIAYNPDKPTYTSKVVTFSVDMHPATEIHNLGGITDVNGSYMFAGDFAPTGTPTSGIGTESNPFRGTIDGNLVEIEISSPLFDYVQDATIKNVIISKATISTNGNAGAIANNALGATRIYNCGVLGTITETANKDAEGKILSYTVTGTSTISGSNYVGSIVGLLDGTSRVINCYSYAVITDGTRIGGIVGYNNVSTTKPANATTGQKTMVMNCMFYGDITGGSTSGDRNAPIYNGNIITNVGQNAGVGNYNYFRAEARYVQDKHINVYNCALAAETRFLNRFEFFRHLLNSNRALAAWWAIGSRENKDEMMKWELETADRSITAPNTPYPYPVLKPVFDDEGHYIQYPSVVNIDAAHAPGIDAKNEHYNEGRKLGDFTIYIRGGDGEVYKAPDGASILKSEVPVVITDKDPERFNFNYYKVQLPYYNDCGTKNYTGNRVVTGWKIVGVSDGGTGTFTIPASDPADAKAENGVITSTPYNFADRNCSNKDLYSVSKRVFSQGAYYDVPEGVTSITIEPYWGKAVYVSDPYLDKVYNSGMSTGYDVTTIGDGLRYENGVSVFNNDNSQYVYTTIAAAVEKVGTSGNVYDNAIVLVGNTHNSAISLENSTKSFTLMSVDLDHDNEPDYSYILRFNERKRVHPVRIDFLNVIGLGMAQKSTGGSGTYNFGIMQPLGWFEVTNTGLFRVTQFEYDKTGRAASPIILQGGVIEQWVTVAETQDVKAANSVSYYHVGGNVWFKEFHIGAHQDKNQYSNKDEFVSPHPPISVTGGDYDNFYLTGYYNTPNKNYDDNAECYINGGRFGKVAGTGYQGIGNATTHTNGNIVWQIDNADIDEFYAGGINHAHIAEGNITTVISNSRVDLFCGGPKFGDMNAGKKVFTNATNCKFRAFFGAGYGGNSYNRRYPKNKSGITNIDWDDWVQNGATIEGEVFEGYKNEYKSEYGGVGVRIDYQFLPQSNNEKNVARLFVDYVSFSLATTHEVTSTLTNCTITTSKLGRLDDLFLSGNFYGGGNLGKVEGPVKSTLTNCTVEGNVFGAGYSASLPPVSVMNNTFQKQPEYDMDLGAFLEAKLPSTVSCQWDPTPVTELTADNAIYTDEEGKTWLRIQSDDGKLDLGTVKGDVTLTISGNKTVIGRSVYGGGEESSVGGNTTVSITDGKIGTKGLEEGIFRDVNGNVFGGGKGDKGDYDLGLVKGNATVTINGNPTIYHNVYGGGAYGSVGTFTYNETTGMPTFTDTDKGKCTVTINGGTIGTTGKDNGMVFGSSRGDEGNPDKAGSILNKLAWTYQTEVVIGSTTDTETPLQIFGSVYGGGENGHNYQNSSVTVNRGTIGVEGDIVDEGEDPESTEDDTVIDNEGASYSQRGNVYGGGCGTDVYYTSDTDGKETVAADGDGIYTWYNPLAGVVGGNATVNINGGTIVHSVYGAGSMGSVGLFTFNKTTNKMECAEGTGRCTVNVSGGRIGTFGMQMPDDWGYVFGAGRGETKDPKKYLNIEQVQFVNETEVTISGRALVTGAVYGGAENGHVLKNTHVTIAGGQIGVGEDMERAYTDEEWAAEDPSVLKECAHWEYTSPYAPYDVYDLEDGKPKPATDGHTFYGNVFGGGRGYFPYGTNPNYNQTMIDNGYSDGLWLRSAGSVGGNTRVDITGGHVLTNVYGGNECTDVEGSCTVNMSGGTIGVPRDFTTNKRFVTCNLFGAGKGDQRINFNQWTNVASTKVSVSGGHIYASVFGGGEDGHVIGDTEVSISQAEGNTTVIGTTGTSGADGNVFGGGRGFSMTALTAGAVCGDVKVNISGGTMLGSVFGGGRLASVGSHIVLVEESHGYYGTLIPDGKKQAFGETANDFLEDVDDAAATHGHIAINISGGTIGSNATSEFSIGEVFGGCKGATENALFGLARNSKITISETDGQTMPTHIYGSVYGGGEAGNLEEGVEVTINGGTIGGDVYGGGAKASTNIKWTKDVADADKGKYYTNVYLHSGVINGRVFGGGLGQKAKAAVGEEGDENYQPAQEAIAAIVGGDVNVELNKNTGSDNCVVKKQIFGCNNLNGTPRGNVTVHIFKTQGWGDNDLGEKKSDPEAEKKGSIYELDAVYGGGNEAAYVPADSYTSYDEETGAYTYTALDEDANACKTNVIIEGCDLTSIRYVYGGGNSAPSPATSVMVRSCYEIGTVFGGGNGADRVDDGTAEGMPNLGANVGYTTYSYVDASKNFHEFYKEEEWPGQSTIWSDTKERRRSNYKYGTGRAETRLFGGTIHNAFGGSNTLGNVCAVAFSALEEASDDCQLKVGQIYGAGNKAFMDAKIEVDLGCISGLDELFGGAMEADVNDNVVLDVTSGSYKQVFGGNNKGGKISGTITVNVREIGCKPVTIGELYGGGDEADYEAPLDPDDATGKRRLQSPVVNIISATSIGTVYGGGRLANVTGNPVVNINMQPGVLYSNDDNASNDVPQSSIGTIGTVFGGGYKGWVHGDTRVEIGTDPEKSVNIQGSVYGGGDNADVIGKTTVIIGEQTIEE